MQPQAQILLRGLVEVKQDYFPSNNTLILHYLLENIKMLQVLPQNAETGRQAIGVKEIESYLAGKCTREECLEKIAISTRQYAKRQRNWFRREHWLHPLDGAKPTDELVEKTKALIAPC